MVVAVAAVLVVLEHVQAAVCQPGLLVAHVHGAVGADRDLGPHAHGRPDPHLSLEVLDAAAHMLRRLSDIGVAPLLPFAEYIFIQPHGHEGAVH